MKCAHSTFTFLKIPPQLIVSVKHFLFLCLFVPTHFASCNAESISIDFSKSLTANQLLVNEKWSELRLPQPELLQKPSHPRKRQQRRPESVSYFLNPYLTYINCSMIFRQKEGSKERSQEGSKEGES
jgi:hypothetical protein